MPTLFALPVLAAVGVGVAAVVGTLVGLSESGKADIELRDNKVRGTTPSSAIFYFPNEM